MKKERYTVAQMRKALEKGYGIPSQAALALKCTPRTVRNYIKRHESLQRAQVEITLDNIDKCVSKLFEKISAGDLGAIIYFLKTQGKEHGWNERVEVTGKDGADLPIFEVVCKKTEDPS